MLSRSVNVKWSIKLISKFQNDFDFDLLSANRSIPINEDYINVIDFEWNFNLLSKNCSVIWTLDLIEVNIENIDLIHIYTIAKNLIFNKEFVHNYRTKIEWKGFYRRFGSDNTLYGASEISMIKHIEIGVETLKECSEKWLKKTDWHDENHNHFGDWYYFSENNFLSLEHLEVFEDKLCWDKISSNPSLVLNSVIIEKFCGRLNWDKILKRPDLTHEIFILISEYLSSEILEENKDIVMTILEPSHNLIYNYLNFGPYYYPINNKYKSSKDYHWADYSVQKKEYLYKYIKQFQSELIFKAIQKHETYYSKTTNKIDEMDFGSWLSSYFELYEELKSEDKLYE